MDAILTIIKGVLIGIANIIPGVSGGTLALMLGIYKRTIDSLGHVNMMLVSRILAVLSFRRGAWAKLWRYIGDSDLLFLGWLGLGAGSAILMTSRLMAWLLAEHHAASYAFFLGLVVCSIIFPWRFLTRHSWREAVAVLLAAVLTVGLSLSVSDAEKIEKAERKVAIKEAKAAQLTGGGGDAGGAEDGAATPDIGRLAFIFMAAILAISAMVLPGISGSFVLLLMGVYFDILGAINQRDFLVLGVFALGALFGLLAFSRIMGVLLERCFNLTMAFMIGLMVGSLYELWPFKQTTVVGGETLYLGGLWRGVSIGEEVAVLLAFMVGCVLVIGFATAGNRRQTIPDWKSVLKP